VLGRLKWPNKCSRSGIRLHRHRPRLRSDIAMHVLGESASCWARPAQISGFGTWQLLMTWAGPRIISVIWTASPAPIRSGEAPNVNCPCVALEVTTADRCSTKMRLTTITKTASMTPSKRILAFVPGIRMEGITTTGPYPCPARAIAPAEIFFASVQLLAPRFDGCAHKSNSSCSISVGHGLLLLPPASTSTPLFALTLLHLEMGAGRRLEAGQPVFG